MSGSAMVGAEPAQLRALAAKLERSSQQLRSAGDHVGGALRTTAWRGPSADTFRQRWAGDSGTCLVRAALGLEKLAHAARKQAAEQEQASSAGGGSTGNGALGGAGPDPGRPAFDQRIEQSRQGVKTRIDRLKGEIAALEHRRPDGGPEEFVKDVLPWVGADSEKINDQLASKRQELARLEGLHADRRSFLLVDSKPGDNRLVEVYGDLATADRVIIHIPGMSTDLDDYGGKGKADALHVAEMAGDVVGSSENVAVISFMDYNVPDDLGEAARGRGVDSGVPPLRNLVSDLHQQGFEAGDLSVVAHSYGSTLAGSAMKEGLDVSRVVVVGSPGMGSTLWTDDRSELGSPNVELWAGSAEGDTDWVSRAPFHGEDPSDAGFGANRLPVPDANGHSSYFRRRSESLWNITSVALGGRPRNG